MCWKWSDIHVHVHVHEHVWLSVVIFDHQSVQPAMTNHYNASDVYTYTCTCTCTCISVITSTLYMYKRWISCTEQ